MLSIAIYTHSEETSLTLRKYIQDFLIDTRTMAKVSVFFCGADLIAIPNRYDVYFIDMDSAEDGIQVGVQLAELDDSGYFVYFSENPLNAHRAIKFGAYHFLDIPFEPEEITKVLLRIRKQVKEDSIVIKTPLGERRVRINNVNYINIVKRCLCYHLKDGTVFDGQALRSSFEKAIYPLQDQEPFLFLSPSLLINVSEIKILNSDHLIFENDEVMFFPKKSYDVIHDYWINYNKIK